MKPEQLLMDEMKESLSFLLRQKDAVKDLDDRIRSTALYLASMDLSGRHPDVELWDLAEEAEDSLVKGMKGSELVVLAKVKTMGLTGKTGMGGRQSESMKKAAEQIKAEGAASSYLYLLDPWTVNVVRDHLKEFDITIRPLLPGPVLQTREKAAEHKAKAPSKEDAPLSLVEEVITKDDTVPTENIIISPISKTSLRQGFIYIPKEKGTLVKEGAMTIWVRKDASIESRCMVSQTGGIRIGGNLTKWFKSANLQAEDELTLAAQPDGSLLVMSIKRVQSPKDGSPVIETVKWD